MDEQILFPLHAVPESLRQCTILLGYVPDGALRKALKYAVELFFAPSSAPNPHHSNTNTSTNANNTGNTSSQIVLPADQAAALNEQLVDLLKTLPDIKKAHKAEIDSMVAQGQPFEVLLTAFYLFLVQGVRSGLAAPQLLEQAKLFSFPAGVLTLLETLWTQRFDEMQASVTGRVAQLGRAHYQGLRWRVDVMITSSAQSKVFRPQIVLEWALTDGSRHSFECPIEKFSELRFQVARVLREMQALEDHPILHIK
jgi:hypothetical protein